MKRLSLCCVIILLTWTCGQSSWTPRKLIGTYQDWNYWWLNVRIGIDQFDSVYCAVARYNYSQDDYEHDLYVLNTDGDTIRVVRPWSGYDYQPIVKDAGNNNIYLGQPVLGQGPMSSPHMDAGVTDNFNCVSTTHARLDSIYFTRLAPNGAHIIWMDGIYGGNPWSGRTSVALDPSGRIHCTFADDREFLLHGVSPNNGVTWSWDTLETLFIMSHVRVFSTPDACIHIIFRTWTSGVQLYYMKLRPDGSVAIAPSIFSQASECWAPNAAIDASGNLRVVYDDAATGSHNIWYTVLRGDLDMGGLPVADSVLTLVPDTIIQYDAVGVAEPKICVDSSNRAHVLFEQGVYGTGTTKYVYHIREDVITGIVEVTEFLAIPKQGYVLLKWRTEMERESYQWLLQRRSGDEDFHTIHTVEAQGNISLPSTYEYRDFDIGFDRTYYYRLVEIDVNGDSSCFNPIVVRLGVPHSLSIKQNFPNPFSSATTIEFGVDLKDEDNQIHLSIQDCTGRQIRDFNLEMNHSGFCTLLWDGRDKDGREVPVGTYFCQLQYGKERVTKKMAKVK
jgi:hypothetical protein